MSLSQYLFGAAELAAIVVALGLGAYHVRALLVPAWNGALARLAEIVLGLSALIVVAELLGLLRLLEEIPLLVACVGVGIGAAIWAKPRHQLRGPGEFPAVRASRWMLAVAIAASALVVAHWAVPTQESLDVGMYYQDTTWYHMSFSGRFAQTGEVGPLHFTDPLKLTAWYYPQNSELLHAIPMVALDNDFVSPMINLGWLALSLLAAWCIGRPYAVGAVTLMGAAVVLDSEMVVGSQAGNAPNDIMGLFLLLAVLAFLVNGAATARAAPRIAGAAGGTAADPPVRRAADGGPGFDPDADQEHPQEGVVTEVPVAGDPRVLAGVGGGALFLAGLAAGLGVGTKITLLPALGVLTIGLAVLAGRRHWIRAMSIWLGAMLLTGGFWYLRNLWHSLNPFPQIDSIGGFSLPGPDQPGFYPREPHSLSEYYNDPTVWKSYFFPVLEDRLGPLWLVVLGAAFVGLALGLLWARSSLLRVLAITGLLAGLAYVFTPLTASGGVGQPTGFDANLRYIAPALVIGLTITSLIPRLRRRPWPWAMIGLFALLIVQGTLRVDLNGFPIETSTSWRFGHFWQSVLLALLVVGIPAGLVAAARAGMRRSMLAGAAVIAFALLVVLGRSQQDRYLQDRYRADLAPQLGSGFRSTPEWTPMQVFAKETEDTRIGVVGRASAFGQYFFYGDDLSNHVQYLGRELRRGTYRQIDRCDDLRRVINDGDYDYVVVTPRIRDEEDEPPESLWISSDAGVTEVVRSGPARIFRVDQALDPGTCRYLGGEQTT
ncbi:MAG TPA: hypothetical protein VE523_10300 [Solirubrobacterales bacterium]|jgi:hypothetical protein|nr:hypothetical protein [Solirubrobacterales bacterium]